MTRTMLFALAATTTVAGGLSAFFGQGTPVELQPTTPGTQQVGNANVSGRIIAGSIQAENGSPTAQVIVGNATSTTGANFGGFFRSDSTLGRALYGRATAASGTTHGVYGQADSPAGRGVTGVVAATSGNATGVWGQTASSGGRGVYGYNTSASGVNYGVYGYATSPAGFGVFSQGNMHATGVISGNGSGLTGVNASQLGGLLPSAFLQAIPNPLHLTGSQVGPVIQGSNASSGSSASGVFGWVTAATGGGYGVGGRSDSGGGRGVFGTATASTGTNYGGYFQANGSTGIAVYGIAPSASGANYGGYFRSASNGGRAVYGYAASTSGTTYGGSFTAVSTLERGVYAEALASTGLNYGGWFQSASEIGRGVYGFASNTTGTNYGVRGVTQSAAGFGVFSGGNTGATGTKSFRIDHPFDPENKYLLHFAAESPMPQNFYAGNVVTDAQGFAWVDLPDYFSEINTNVKYQLTIVGKSFAQAIVWEEVKGNRFRIRTSTPNIKVSWRVEADRNDLYVRNRPPKDVVEKQGLERGTYQHPEFYGFGPERGMDYNGDRANTQEPVAQRKR